jgi:hypothetical protein
MPRLEFWLITQLADPIFTIGLPQHTSWPPPHLTITTTLPQLLQLNLSPGLLLAILLLPDILI